MTQDAVKSVVQLSKPIREAFIIRFWKGYYRIVFKESMNIMLVKIVFKLHGCYKKMYYYHATCRIIMQNEILTESVVLFLF